MVIQQTLKPHIVPPKGAGYDYIKAHNAGYAIEFEMDTSTVITADPINEILKHVGTGSIIEIKLSESNVEIIYGKPMFHGTWHVYADHKHVAKIFNVVTRG